MDKEFFQRLSDINPNLTPNERRLCALLRMNMSSKEISLMTGQSLESIRKGRIRLRSKLNLTNTETNISDFLNAI